MRKTALVKVSGDLFQNDKFLEWLKTIADEYFVVICVGGGKQINEAFKAHGLPVGGHGPLGRETRTLQEKQVARDVLEENQAIVQDILAAKKISAVVVIPVNEVGSVLCHVNGDIYVLMAHHGFDRIFVVTTPERLKQKKATFVAYPKIEVVALPL